MVVTVVVEMSSKCGLLVCMGRTGTKVQQFKSKSREVAGTGRDMMSLAGHTEVQVKDVHGPWDQVCRVCAEGELLRQEGR